jgi:hypothetical protein
MHTAPPLSCSLLAETTTMLPLHPPRRNHRRRCPCSLLIGPAVSCTLLPPLLPADLRRGALCIVGYLDLLVK